MRVLIFTPELRIGAAEQLAVQLAVDLNRNGVHADLLALHADNEDDRRERDSLAAAGVSKIWFLGLDKHPSWWRVIRAVLKVVDLVRRERYDVVETSATTTTVIASLAAKLLRVQHIVGFHQTFLESDANHLRFRILRFLLRRSKSARFYGVSSAVKNSWTSFSGLPSARTQVVPNSIRRMDPCCEKGSAPGRLRARIRVELGAGDGTTLVLCCGRVATYKGQDIVVEALSPLSVARDIVVAFVGSIDESVEGTTEMVATVRKQLERSGLMSRFRFLGYRHDIHDLMCAANLLVHVPSREAFGLVVGEAMALRLPVIATNVEGIPEVIGNTAFRLISPGDPHSLRDAVLAFMDAPARLIDDVTGTAASRSLLFSQERRTEGMLHLMSGGRGA